MDEALELGSYLPLSFKTKSEEEYIRFLWDAFQSNYISEKYEFSSLAFHLLYMSFVSFAIWQIRLARDSAFKHALVGFELDAENALLNAETPFKFYEELREAQIFRFLKLIGCENEEVGEFGKFVRRRNKIAHPSGTVFFNDRDSIDSELTKMMREVANIQRHMGPIIKEIYASFLAESADPEEREYADPNEEIEASLIHHYYISQEDLAVCAAYDLTPFRNHHNLPDIEALHRSLRSTYAEAAGEPLPPQPSVSPEPRIANVIESPSPQLPADEAVIGIDVGGQRKGFHAVALQNGAFDRIASQDPAEITEWCRQHKAATVAVDAPCGWSLSGPSRLAERELKLGENKIHLYCMPTRDKGLADTTGFYDWVFNGEKLYELLKPHYPLFEGDRQEGPACLESFPHAVACALTGKIVPADQEVRRKILTEQGYDVSSLPNADFVDAALCALAGRAFREGRSQHFGQKGEGFIVVPVTRAG
jgi:predicted nuclease with RNAse H fold